MPWRAMMPKRWRRAAVVMSPSLTARAHCSRNLFALIPRQGASQLLRQLADVLGKLSNNSRRVLAGNPDEHRKARIALDESGYVRVVRSGKKVAFPMPWHGAILNLGRPLADGDHIEDMPLSTLRVVAVGATHPPRSTQMRRQLLLQHAAGLDEDTAIDRFVRYLHVLVGWELLLQPAGDLFRRPLQRELLRHAPS